MMQRQHNAFGETLSPKAKLKKMVREADEAQLDRIVQAIYSVLHTEEGNADVPLLQIQGGQST